MPVDFDATPDGDPTRIESETPMFAPIPTWERNKKRRGFGGRRVAAEPRTFADPVAEPAERDVIAPAPVAATPATGERLDTVDYDEPTFVRPPTFAGNRRVVVERKSGGMAPMAIAGGLVLLAGVAATGWYYYGQPRDQGVAMLTPGGEPPATTSLAPPADQAAPAPAPAPEPNAPPATKAAPVRTARAAAPPRPAPARAASPSAADTGVNASAVAPSPTPAPVQTAPVTPAPTQAAPAPAPAPVTPAPSDVTPAPTQTAPPTPPQQPPSPPNS